MKYLCHWSALSSPYILLDRLVKTDTTLGKQWQLRAQLGQGLEHRHKGHSLTRFPSLCNIIIVYCLIDLVPQKHVQVFNAPSSLQLDCSESGARLRLISCNPNSKERGERRISMYLHRTYRLLSKVVSCVLIPLQR